MSPFKINLNPQSVAHAFENCIRSMVSILLWTVIGLASLSAAFLIVSIIWFGVKFV